jgi:phosphoglycerol transferase
MMKKNEISRIKYSNGKNIPYYLVLLVLITVQFFHISPIVPMIADEYYYNLYSRLLSIDGSLIPNFLYLRIYSLTSYCGGNFYICNKFLNLLFYFLSGLVVFKITNLYADKGKSFLICILFIIGPLNSVTSYFMPESLYILFFTINIYFILKNKLDNYIKSILIGISVGVLSLIKPHAIFLILPLCIYYVFIIKIKNPIKKIIVLILAFFIFKYIFGFLLAGRNGLTLFGTYYGSLMGNGYDLFKIFNILKFSTYNFIGHFISLLPIIFFPLIIIIFNFKNWKIKNIDKFEFSGLAILILLTLISVTSIFTSQLFVMSGGIYDLYTRLNLRYYNFTIFLFYIVLVIPEVDALKNYNGNRGKWFVFLAMAFGLILTVYMKIYTWNPDYTDAPEFYALYFNIYVFYGIIFANFIILIIWMLNENFALKIYLYILLPSLVVYLTSVNFNELNKHKNNIYIQAPKIISEIYGNESIKNTVIIGQDPGQLYLSLFSLNSPDVNPNKNAKFLKNDEIIDVENFKNNLLVIGDYNIINIGSRKVISIPHATYIVYSE